VATESFALMVGWDPSPRRLFRSAEAALRSGWHRLHEGPKLLAAEAKCGN